jgi:hypothetical protein
VLDNSESSFYPIKSPEGSFLSNRRPAESPFWRLIGFALRRLKLPVVPDLQCRLKPQSSMVITMGRWNPAPGTLV